MSLSDPATRRRRGIELLRNVADASVRLTVLSSFNLDLLPPFVAEALDRRGLSADVRTAGFGQIAQALYAGVDGDVLVVAAPEDLFDAGAPDANELAAARLAELTAAVTAALTASPATTLYLVAFPAMRVANANVLDPLDPRRGQRASAAFVDGVRGLGALSGRVVVVDWDWAARAQGWTSLVDDRLWYMGRMRLNPAGLASLADLSARVVAADRGRARKVCVVDLDGTLWGGILGEAGVHGIDVGDEKVALAYADFQRELLRLKAAGTVLAIASKNDRDLVVEAFEQHAGMVVSLADFAAERIDWTDKATNLRELAAELDVGLDAFVFLDDNPVEREWVRRALPEVAVPELPQDPSLRPAFVRDLGLFDRVRVTDADAGRAASYAANAQRRRARTGGMSFEAFLASLEQEVTIEAVDDTTLARAAQLCQRTNQFNLTTRRHTLAELEAMLAADGHELYAVGVRDRFGDSGTTGLAILALRDGDAEVDTLLLSCRVLGRRVEDALLGFLAARARELGATRLVGIRVPTERNGQTQSFYADRGFVAAGDGVFVRDLADGELPQPDEMTIKVRTSAQSHS